VSATVLTRWFFGCFFGCGLDFDEGIEVSVVLDTTREEIG
jgi:hypothetical protein